MCENNIIILIYKNYGWPCPYNKILSCLCLIELSCWEKGIIGVVISSEQGYIVFLQQKT